MTALNFIIVSSHMFDLVSCPDGPLTFWAGRDSEARPPAIAMQPAYLLSMKQQGAVRVAAHLSSVHA